MASKIIAVAGNGPVHKPAVVELLEDYLGDDEATFVFPADEDHITQAVRVVYDWSAEYGFLAVSTGSGGRYADKILDDVEGDNEIVECTPDALYETIVHTLLSSGDEPILLIAADEGGVTGVDTLVSLAANEGIEIRNLADGLHEYELRGDPDEPVEEDPENEEPAKGGKQTLVPLDDNSRPETLEDEVAAARHKITAAPSDGPDVVIHALESALAHLEALNEAHAAAFCAPVGTTPLTELVRRGRDAATKLKYHNPLAEAGRGLPEQPKPAAKTGKVRKEWYDPEAKEWKPVRGRPRKGVEIREVSA